MTTDLAAQAIELAVAKAGTGAEVEVYVDRTELALTRFANSYIHQNVAHSATSVRLRVHVDGRTATGSSTLIGDDGLRELVERTVAGCRLMPVDPRWPGLAPPSAAPGTGWLDEETVRATPDDRADRVAAFVAAAGGLECAGFCRTSMTSGAYVNSLGQTLSGAGSEASLDAIARTGGADGAARLASWRVADLDGAVLGARAAAKARAGVDPAELPPGVYEVVFEPGAVQDLISNLSFYAFNGKAVEERRSCVELGTDQFDPAVSLVDDVTEPGAIGLPFDVEGTPRHRLSLVDNGRSVAVAHDRRTAAATGGKPTGHSIGSIAFGPLTSNLGLVPAPGDPATEVDGPAADSSVLDLVAGVGRGLLVTDLWYTRVLDPRPLVVTGLTRNGVWLVEDGEIRGAVQNLRFTQAYPASLAPGQVRGVGTTPVTQPASWLGAAYRAPALHLAAWNFTGNASG